MINDTRLWQFIHDRISQSKRVMLLCVLDSKGSSPGRKGFKMAVALDGFFGSIGGGIMEHKFVEMAKMKLLTVSEDSLIQKQIHSKSAKLNQSGMICSGEQTIVLFPLIEKYSVEISAIIHCLENNRNGLLKISHDSISFSEKVEDCFNIVSEKDWQYQEILGYKNQLFIIGGGHCGLALSQLMKTIGFYIYLFDDRNNLNTYEENIYVNQKKTVSDFSELKELIPSGDNIYIVVMTFGYRTDDLVIRTLIEKNFKYLGVLGSKSKIDKMFEEWRKDNLPEEQLKKIYSPIGIQIKSQTPEEIAISIAAEIISVKNMDN